MGIGTISNESEGFRWSQESARAGNIDTIYNIGCCYDGKGVIVVMENQTVTFEWYKKAAESDDNDGQCMIGKCFYGGYGIKRDIVKAIFWLNKTKEKGNTDANRLLEIIELERISISANKIAHAL
ncbi:1550_t:CDS:2 [Diversispora eburnea]|uniref:1550_t:CDS:1 n=1 Tax=Diversispora eburnea TaxID=1213867 RepID=A0A9N9FP77_9GLOM|nr:1550_t:CDS:2 [Diversispora eburnea]